MSKVILLLPDPDVLQIANCHKYVTRLGLKAYSDIYTFTTITGKCTTGVEKILVIGHGNVGGFDTAKVAKLTQAILKSSLPLTCGSKVTFDTCFAGVGDDSTESAMLKVSSQIRFNRPQAHLCLSGSTGPTVTIGGDKRLVVPPSNLDSAAQMQEDLLDSHNVDLFEKPKYWREDATSEEIKGWAKKEYDRLLAFSQDFRGQLSNNNLLDDTAGRKLQVQF